MLHIFIIIMTIEYMIWGLGLKSEERENVNIDTLFDLNYIFISFTYAHRIHIPCLIKN